MAERARPLALRILGRAATGSATLDDLLAAPECEALDARERGFLHELVLGTLRRRGALDETLVAVTDRPLARLDAVVLDILRLGAHQILNLRVPDRAAVNESVELARAAAPPAAGFVNAVLRRLARERERLPASGKDDALRWLTGSGSLPSWLAQRWLARLGPAAAIARAEAQLQPPPAVLRLNPRSPSAAQQLRDAGVDVEPHDVAGAWTAVSGELQSLRRSAVVYLQDAGSQLVGQLAAEGQGPFLDACAAPGGKSTLIADRHPSASVVALERSPRRARLLAALARGWGAANVQVACADALAAPFARTFPTILLDAPCSGLGTLARHPDIRWRAQADDLARHAQRQRAMLAALAPFVAPGGRLVYAVCSLEPEETTQVVAAFLEQHAAFQALPPPAWAARYREGDGVSTRPERDGGDGFFAVVLGPR